MQTKSSLHITECIQRALSTLSGLTPSAIGPQLDKMRLGLSVVGGNGSNGVEDAAIRRADSVDLRYLRGLTRRQMLALYLRYRWRPGWVEGEATHNGATIGERQPLRATDEQIAQVLEVSVSAAKKLVERGRAIVRDNIRDCADRLAA